MKPEPADIRVFISFATPDRDAAWNICEGLESRGFSCWISLRDLDTGSRYGDEIVRRIRTSDALVLVLSSAANESEFVHREVERAVNYRTPVFPVRIENVAPGDALELFISANQWIDLWSGDFGDTIDRLSEDLRKRAGRKAGVSSSAEAAAAVTRTAANAAESGARAPDRGARGAWMRRYGGLVLAALAVAVFGIVNITSSGNTSPIELESPSQTSGAAADDPIDQDPPQAGAERARKRGDAAPGTQTDATDPADGTANGDGASPRDRARPERPTHGATDDGDEDAPPTPPATPAQGVLVIVYGEADAGAETVEGILLGELAKGGHSVLDRTTLDPGSAASAAALDAARLGRLRAESGVALVIVADLRSEAAPSVGDMYTGRATLAVRTYDTTARRLTGTQTYQVGAGGSAGELAASPLAAAHQAAVRVAHQAAIGIGRAARLTIDR